MFYEISCSRFLALWLLIFVSQNSLSTTGLEVNIDRHKNSWAVRMQRSVTKEDVLSLSEKFGLKPDKVLWAEQENPKELKKRAVSFDDPDWSGQEYLKTGNSIGHNVEPVWEKGFTGKSITVAVVDDGLKFTHEEFKNRYVAELSYDYIENDSSPDPSPEGHGTRCAGIIAGAADNGYCGVGVAYDANIAAIRLIETKPATDANEAKAFYPFTGHGIDIFSNSWGPPDNAMRVRGPQRLSQRALKDGTTMGRNGLGSIYVFSAGNGGTFGDSCAFNGYVNSIYTIPVAAMKENRKISPVSEPCSAIMTSAYSINLKTASSSDNFACDRTFGQTSGATALVSGIIALALQAKKSLTWRDTQHLVVRSSNPAAVDDPNANWIENKAGFRVSDRVGFGVLDASMLVTKAQQWNSSVPPQIKCEISLSSPRQLTDKVEIATLRFNVNRHVCRNGVIRYLEHVQLRVDLRYHRRALIAADITSPGGTKSKVLYARLLDVLTGASNFTNWTTMSVHFWGEQSEGSWTISFKNDLPFFGRGNGTLFGLSLILYGTLTHPERGTNGTKDDKDKNSGKGVTTSFPKHLTTRTDRRPPKIKASTKRTATFTDPGGSRMSAKSKEFTMGTSLHNSNNVSKGVLAAIIVTVIVSTLVVIVVVVMIILPKVRPPQNIQHNGNEPGDGHVITERRETPGYWISFHSL